MNKLILLLALIPFNVSAEICNRYFNHDYKREDGSDIDVTKLTHRLYVNDISLKDQWGKDKVIAWDATRVMWWNDSECPPCESITMKSFEGAVESVPSTKNCDPKAPVMCEIK